jgi:hypothetical protein
MKTDENVEKVRTLVRTHYCLGIRMTAEVNKDKEMASQILTNLNMKKVCSQKTNTIKHSLYSPDPVHVTFSFPKIEEFIQRNPFSVN